MFKTNKTNKGFIITIISIAVCFIVFLILKITIRGDMNTASGGELLSPMSPLIVYLFLKNFAQLRDLSFHIVFVLFDLFLQI